MNEPFKYVPKRLKQQSQWVNWRYEARQGKKTKVPYNASNHQRCDVTNPANYTSFKVAVLQCTKHENYDGIGLCLTKESGIVGIDLDKAFHVNGKIKPWAQQVIGAFPPETYWEISPSGKGLRAFVRGKLNAKRRKKQLANGAIEVYDKSVS